MSNMTSAVQFASDLEDTATKAVFQMQYRTVDAVRYIQKELPECSELAARAAVASVAKPRKQVKA